MPEPPLLGPTAGQQLIPTPCHSARGRALHVLSRERGFRLAAQIYPASAGVSLEEQCLHAPVCTRVGVCGTQQCPGECRDPVCPWLAPVLHTTPTHSLQAADLVAESQGLGAALQGTGNCSGRHRHGEEGMLKQMDFKQ